MTQNKYNVQLFLCISLLFFSNILIGGICGSSEEENTKTVDTNKKEVELEATGRHDPCVVPRAVPIVETMAALVLCDHYLRFRTQCGDVDGD